MRGLIAAAAAGLLCAGIAQAGNGHHGACEIEDWRWYSAAGSFLMVEGVATCDLGHIRIRLYEGEGDKPKFLGTAEGLVKGHIFDAIGQSIPEPQALSIKYSIEPQ